MFGRAHLSGGRAALAAVACVAALAAGAPARAQPVDLALILAIDVSFSVNAEEFRQQADGTAAALTNPEVLKAIQANPHGRIAVAVVQWADHNQQAVAVDWRLVADRADAEELARAVAEMPRLADDGATSVSAAMRFAARLFLDLPYRAERQVLDISSDGRHNRGPRLQVMRRQVGRQGITVNALTILNEAPTLDSYYRERIIVGDDPFVVRAETYADYRRAIRTKLLREIGYDPVARAPGPRPVTAARR
jgi:hypothetical protein